LNRCAEAKGEGTRGLPRRVPASADGGNFTTSHGGHEGILLPASHFTLHSSYFTLHPSPFFLGFFSVHGLWSILSAAGRCACSAGSKALLERPAVAPGNVGRFGCEGSRAVHAGGPFHCHAPPPASYTGAGHESSKRGTGHSANRHNFPCPERIVPRTSRPVVRYSSFVGRNK